MMLKIGYDENGLHSGVWQLVSLLSGGSLKAQGSPVDFDAGVTSEVASHLYSLGLVYSTHQNFDRAIQYEYKALQIRQFICRGAC